MNILQGMSFGSQLLCVSPQQNRRLIRSKILGRFKLCHTIQSCCRRAQGTLAGNCSRQHTFSVEAYWATVFHEEWRDERLRVRSVGESL